jgi:protein-export membrane protein SecD|tara:strand:+ start:3955 stop:5724 length:1770 start_codon:yes stop_codon:yes gene_type:complete
MLYFRWIIFLGITILSIVGILPTVDYYSNYFKKDLNQEQLIASKTLKDKSLTLGLDLQGGIHMVLELDLVDLYKNIVNEEYKNDFKEMDEYEKELIKINDYSSSIEFIDNLFTNYDNQNLINYYSDFLPINISASEEILELKKILKSKLSSKLISSTEIIRNRIDGLGVTEPLIQTKGMNQIIVEIAGIQDTSRAESLIKNTGKLEFIVVKDNIDRWKEIIPLINNDLKNYFYFNYNGLIDFYELSNLPSAPRIQSLLVKNTDIIKVNSLLNGNNSKEALANSQLLWGKENEGLNGFTSLYLLNRTIEISGIEIKDPKAQQYPFDDINSGQWYISLGFNNPYKFEEITEDNKGKFLAIVLDNEVKMAPRINQKITGGYATITGNFTGKEAKDIETILVAGELPAKINIASQLQVDASLGQDSINAGFKSIIIAFISVLIFMIFFYKSFGILANIAMILNLLYIIAFLSNPWINATLSLPGIAGMILTVGMAIDANVIIFERIKEELLKNKSFLDAIEFGYQKAFRTILDSNLTTLVSALSLYTFGSGPIKGFAVTLSVGIVCSMFTAIFITKTILLSLFNTGFIKKISI